MLVKLGFVVLGGAVAVWLVGTSYARSIAAIERKVQAEVNGQYLVLEVARTPRDRERGLSGRGPLSVNEGMMFVFEAPGTYPFWMKGMQFPIDIVWVERNRVVGFEERVPPQLGARDEELRIYYPPAPVQKVLELAAGRAGLLRLRSGDRVVFRPFIFAP